MMRLRSAAAVLGAAAAAGATQRYLPSGPLIIGYAADTECELFWLQSAELPLQVGCRAQAMAINDFFHCWMCVLVLCRRCKSH